MSEVLPTAAGPSSKMGMLHLIPPRTASAWAILLGVSTWKLDSRSACVKSGLTTASPLRSSRMSSTLFAREVSSTWLASVTLKAVHRLEANDSCRYWLRIKKELFRKRARLRHVCQGNKRPTLAARFPAGDQDRVRQVQGEQQALPKPQEARRHDHGPCRCGKTAALESGANGSEDGRCRSLDVRDAE
eukprot:1327360-Rhodomonas_salina.2